MRKPGPIQKLLHRFFMLRPVTAFFASRVHHIDRGILNLTRGKFTASEILGWNIIQLISIGAKTNQSRVVPLVALFEKEKIALIASSFGQQRNPGWYYNLKARPECEVRFNGRSGEYIAHEANGAEYEYFWQMAVSFYTGYAKYKERASHRHIPVMVLTPKK